MQNTITPTALNICVRLFAKYRNTKTYIPDVNAKTIKDIIREYATKFLYKNEKLNVYLIFALVMF